MPDIWDAEKFGHRANVHLRLGTFAVVFFSLLAHASCFFRLLILTFVCVYVCVFFIFFFVSWLFFVARRTRGVGIGRVFFFYSGALESCCQKSAFSGRFSAQMSGKLFCLFFSIPLLFFAAIILEVLPRVHRRVRSFLRDRFLQFLTLRPDKCLPVHRRVGKPKKLKSLPPRQLRKNIIVILLERR